MRVDLWAELPSPVKTEFRSAFRDYALRAFRESGILLRDYIPAAMSAQMPCDDYLLHMREEALPECYISGAYGECSMPEFIRKFLDSGIYRQPEILCYFPEIMIADLKRLGTRPVPETYADLSDPQYERELCLIGNRGLPDPLLPLFIYHLQGTRGVNQLRKNIAALASPSTTIRTLGRQSNRYGSVFVMPAMFAQICRSLRNVQFIQPPDGFLAEPILVFYREGIDSSKERLIRTFLSSDACRALLLEACFPVPGNPDLPEFPIDPWCKAKRLYPERYDCNLPSSFLPYSFI